MPQNNTDPEFNNPQRETAGEAASNALLAEQNNNPFMAAYYAGKAERARDQHQYPYQG